MRARMLCSEGGGRQGRTTARNVHPSMCCVFQAESYSCSCFGYPRSANPPTHRAEGFPLLARQQPTPAQHAWPHV